MKKNREDKNLEEKVLEGEFSTADGSMDRQHNDDKNHHSYIDQSEFITETAEQKKYGIVFVLFFPGVTDGRTGRKWIGVSVTKSNCRPNYFPARNLPCFVYFSVIYLFIF